MLGAKTNIIITRRQIEPSATVIRCCWSKTGYLVRYISYVGAWTPKVSPMLIDYEDLFSYFENF
jgi:hypothetical protein